jgi:phosphosulfolactate synthase
MNAVREVGFQGIAVPQRQQKPRSRGLTMMIDWGMPLGQQEDVLACSGDLIDKAKIAAGIPRVMPRDLLMAKLAAYREAGISTANGGMFTELALKQGSYDVLLQELVETGFDAVEVSKTSPVTSNPAPRASIWRPPRFMSGPSRAKN